MAKKSKKSNDVSDDVPSSTNQIKAQSESTKKAPKSEKSSSLWLIFFVLYTGAICYGIKVFYLDEEFSKIAETFSTYENKLNAALKSQSNSEQLLTAIQSVSEMKESLEYLQKKVSLLETSVSTLSASQLKLEANLKNYEDSARKGLVADEKKRQLFEKGLSDKIALFEKNSGNRLGDMLKEVAAAKQLSETVDRDTKEMKDNLNYEFTAAVTRLTDEYQRNEGKISKQADRVAKLEGQILKLQTGDDKMSFDDVNKEMQRLSAAVADISRGLNQVEDDVKQSDQKMESLLGSLTENLKKSSEQVSRMRDDVTDLYATLEELEKEMAEKSEPSENAKKNVKQQASGEN